MTTQDVHFSAPINLHCPYCGAVDVETLDVSNMRERDADLRVDFYKIRHNGDVIAHELPDHQGKLRGRTTVIGMHGLSCNHYWQLVFQSDSERTKFFECGDGTSGGDAPPPPTPPPQQADMPVMQGTMLIGGQPVPVAQVHMVVAPQANVPISFVQAVWQRAVAILQAEHGTLGQWAVAATPRGVGYQNKFWIDYATAHAPVARAMALPQHARIIATALARALGHAHPVEVGVMIDGKPVDQKPPTT